MIPVIYYLVLKSTLSLQLLLEEIMVEEEDTVARKSIWTLNIIETFYEHSGAFLWTLYYPNKNFANKICLSPL